MVDAVKDEEQVWWFSFCTFRGTAYFELSGVRLGGRRLPLVAAMYCAVSFGDEHKNKSRGLCFQAPETL